jgi:hypothetical protein
MNIPHRYACRDLQWDTSDKKEFPPGWLLVAVSTFLMAGAFALRGLRLVADVAARRNWRLAKVSNFMRGKYARLSFQADGWRSGRDVVEPTDGPDLGRERRSPADKRADAKLRYAANPESPLHVHPSLLVAFLAVGLASVSDSEAPVFYLASSLQPSSADQLRWCVVFNGTTGLDG